MDESLGWVLAQIWMLFSPIAGSIVAWSLVAVSITLALALAVAAMLGRRADRRMYSESEWTDLPEMR